MKERIDLEDVSFLIAIRIESDDRLKNIQTVLKYLNSAFKCQILVAESDVVPKLRDTEQFDFDYFFLKDNEPFLWRTKIINFLIHISKTPYCVIYDADVIVPETQILSAVNMIRNGQASYSIPYDGTFLQVDPYNRRVFNEHMDIDWLIFNKSVFSIDSLISKGGAFVFCCRHYKTIGMENENIQGWGHDDVERYLRIKNRGYVVPRVVGPLFHLWHSRNKQSYFFDLNKAIRSYEIFFKECYEEKE